MDSPPSTSLWSEAAFILSDDSGLLLTSGSISSGSMSGESRSGIHQPFELQDSDLSQVDSLDGMSDIICGEHFNTLKKGPHWFDAKTTIEPPLEFQDYPPAYEHLAESLAVEIIDEALAQCLTRLTRHHHNVKQLNHLHVFRPIYGRNWNDFLPFSPCHGRPSSRSSLSSSRLSSSHNSLSVPTAHRADDSSFITQAVSHDTLTSNQISDLYNVPFDSDVYALPVDTVKPPLRPKRLIQAQKKRRRNTAQLERQHVRQTIRKQQRECSGGGGGGCGEGAAAAKRHSVAGTSTTTSDEPVHMTLQEVRQYLQTLYSSSSDSESKERKKRTTLTLTINNNKYTDSNKAQQRKRTFLLNNIKNIKKVKDCDNNNKQISAVGGCGGGIGVATTGGCNNKEQQQQQRVQQGNNKKSPAKVFWLKQTLCNMFKFRRVISPTKSPNNNSNNNKTNGGVDVDFVGTDVVVDNNKKIVKRALPPLPGQLQQVDAVDESPTFDFATSIRKVKDYGWYWGPLSSEGAEKILSNEPDGSFIVRDSSDDHYIFSLTFKLNNSVRHVRIEHDQGNFSFGSCTKFKSQTIVEFIENAVEHSRSGRYLFFLHRRPTIGPVRVQLLHPVSRFKQTQSLQHMCRFVILKKVRKDLIPSLPLPRRMIDYLSTPHYYSEHLVDIDELDEFDRRAGGPPLSATTLQLNNDAEYGSDLNEEISALNLQ